MRFGLRRANESKMAGPPPAQIDTLASSCNANLSGKLKNLVQNLYAFRDISLFDSSFLIWNQKYRLAVVEQICSSTENSEAVLRPPSMKSPER